MMNVLFFVDIVLRLWIAVMLLFIGIMMWRQADE